VAPSARRPDLHLPPAIDRLVLRALEKDRDRRWQNMDEVMEAVAACAVGQPSSGAPPPRASNEAQAAVTQPVRPNRDHSGAVTQQMGGPAAMPIVKSAQRGSSTEMMTREEAEPALDDERPRTRPQGSSTKLLIGAGVLVGVAGAVFWGLFREQPRPPAPVPPPPVAVQVPPPPPVQTPPPVAKPPVAPPPAVEPTPTPETGKKPAAKEHGKKPGYRRIVLPEEQPPATTPETPPPPAHDPPARNPATQKKTPIELKPFPGQ
jgi:hypothetical protein